MDSIESKDLAKQTRKLHRKKFWRTIRYRSEKPFMRILCVLRRHSYWEVETLLSALASGRSKRCRWCNRLVLKPKFRT